MSTACDAQVGRRRVAAQAVGLVLKVVDGLADYLFLAGGRIEPLQDATEEEARPKAATTEAVVMAAVAAVMAVVTAASYRRETNQTGSTNEESEHRSVPFVRRLPLGPSEGTAVIGLSGPTVKRARGPG